MMGLQHREIIKPIMDKSKKNGRYQRLYKQIKDLIEKSSNNPTSNMVTILAVLHHKMDYFFWTGFYLLQEGKLQVGPYQGALACINLAKETGVCWAAINTKKTVIVADVEVFPGHIACDSRSKSEIVIPLKNQKNEIMGVLDVDSSELHSFDEIDAQWLEKIAGLVFSL
jgi:GAF domain-containing protein